MPQLVKLWTESANAEMKFIFRTGLLAKKLSTSQPMKTFFGLSLYVAKIVKFSQEYICLSYYLTPYLLTARRYNRLLEQLRNLPNFD